MQTPRLMRQVNGLDAVPVADNIINLQFTYDVINSVNGTVVANQQIRSEPENPLDSDSEGQYLDHGKQPVTGGKKITKHVSGNFCEPRAT